MGGFGQVCSILENLLIKILVFSSFVKNSFTKLDQIKRYFIETKKYCIIVLLLKRKIFG